MRKELSKEELLLVNGGACFCCCYRNPPIVSYGGIMVGSHANEAECAKTCNSNQEYSGVHSCGDDFLICSPLNNQEVFAKILFLRKKYNNVNLWSGVDVS